MYWGFSTGNLFMCALVGLSLGCRSKDAPVPANAPELARSSEQAEPVSSRPLQATEPRASTEAFQFRQVPDEVTGETRFILDHPSCKLELSGKLDSDGLIIGRYGGCALPAADYRNVWRDGLKSVMDSLGFAGQRVHLVWGRIASPPDDTMGPVMSQRLVATVHGTGAWDSKNGRVLGDRHINEFVREHVTPKNLFPEFVSVVQAQGFTVSVAHVEKVLVGTPDSWPGEPLAGTPRDDKYPYDAQLVFLLTRLSN